MLCVQEALSEWLRLEALMAPVAAAAVAIPAAALRQDAWGLLTVCRFLPRMLPVLLSVGLLLQPFSVILDKVRPGPRLAPTPCPLCCSPRLLLPGCHCVTLSDGVMFCGVTPSHSCRQSPAPSCACSCSLSASSSAECCQTGTNCDLTFCSVHSLHLPQAEAQVLHFQQQQA